VVDDHRKSRAQLDLAGGDHRVALLDAREDRDLVAARFACRDELLLRDERDLVVLPLALFHDEHGVAEGIVGDRGLREREETPATRARTSSIATSGRSSAACCSARLRLGPSASRTAPPSAWIASCSWAGS